MSLIIIGINYEEFEPDSYENVYVNDRSNEDKLFASGDVIKDFSDAVDYAMGLTIFDSNNRVDLYNTNVGNIVFSSSVDNFLMDTDDKYGLDENSLKLYIQ